MRLSSAVALPSPSRPAVAQPLTFLVMTVAVSACAGSKKAPSKHAAHGHAVAMIERDDDSHMLERVEDEDTHWVELPHFGECPYDTDDIPPFEPVDDGHVPNLNPERTRMTNMDAGDATIHNEALLQHLDHATAEVLACVSVSACYEDHAAAPGSIDFVFEVAPTGAVRGVEVEATPELERAGIRECARVAIWHTDFPAFDGADMVVSYRLDID